MTGSCKSLSTKTKPTKEMILFLKSEQHDLTIVLFALFVIKQMENICSHHLHLKLSKFEQYCTQIMNNIMLKSINGGVSQSMLILTTSL